MPFPIYCTKRAMPSDGIPDSGQLLSEQGMYNVGVVVQALLGTNS